MLVKQNTGGNHQESLEPGMGHWLTYNGTQLVSQIAKFMAQSAPDEPHVGPMNPAIRVDAWSHIRPWKLKTWEESFS